MIYGRSRAKFHYVKEKITTSPLIVMRTKDNIFSQYLLKYSLKWNKNSHQKYTQVYVKKCGSNCFSITDHDT